MRLPFACAHPSIVTRPSARLPYALMPESIENRRCVARENEPVHHLEG